MAAKADMTERQVDVLKALHASERPAKAADVAAKLAGSPDPRGVGQTLRRLRDAGTVEQADGGWRFTKSGAAKVRRLVSA